MHAPQDPTQNYLGSPRSFDLPRSSLERASSSAPGPHRLRRRRWSGLILLIVSVLAPAAAPGALGAEEPAPSEPTVVIEGRGWGHGVGMAQDGALALG
ncbi:MAG TPA: hypothetical protein VM386_04950, partial [Acidimicrobiales bacterium]|nr:hypothetical protein [Acidimicrobiales bacterium]